jgi:hypothetical protein
MPEESDAASGAVASGVQAGTAATTTVSTTPPSYTFSVERDLDLVSLDITFSDFTYSNKAGVVSLVPGSDALIVVQFAPQAIGEAAYLWSPTSTDPDPVWEVDPPPVLSVMSGPSRLCFTTGTPVTFSNPMSVDDLLKWSEWTLLVPATAVAGSDAIAPKPADPTNANVTYIEYPYGLYLSPTVYGHQLGQPSQTVNPNIVNRGSSPSFSTIFSPTGGWKDPATSVCDCWSGVLSQTSADGTAMVPSVAAVWARDYDQATSATPETQISYAT